MNVPDWMKPDFLVLDRADAQLRDLDRLTQDARVPRPDGFVGSPEGGFDLDPGRVVIVAARRIETPPRSKGSA